MTPQMLATGTLVAALALAGPAFGQEPSGKGKEWDELVKAAQREGQVEVIMYGGYNMHKAMPIFEKKYGIKVNYQTGSSRQHAARILAERRIGRYTVDAWMGGANTALTQLIPNGVLTPVDDLLVAPDVKDQSKWFQGKHWYTDPDRRYIFAWGASPSSTMSYNTNLVKPEEIKSYADLLNPKWKGKIVAQSPAAQGQGASSVPLVLNEKVGYEWFRRWANEMDVTMVDNARQGAEWMAMGRFAIGMFGVQTRADDLKAQGFPVEDHLPHPMKEGQVLSASAANLMAVDNAPNPNAMKLFVNWVLSREAQQALIELAQVDSLRTDVDNSVIPPHDRIQPDGDYFVAFGSDDYINKQTEILNNLKKIMREAGFN